MVAEWGFYRTTRTGDGLSLITGYRSKMHQYLNVKFSNMTFHHRPVSYLLAEAESTELDTAEVDADIVRIGPRHASKVAFETWIESKVDVLTAAERTVLEDDGVDVGWRSVSTKIKEVIKFLIQLNTMVGRIVMDADSEVLQFLNRGLDQDYSSIPAAQRIKIENWMDSNRLDRTFIGGGTKIRDLVRKNVQNGNWPIITLRGVTFE